MEARKVKLQRYYLCILSKILSRVKAKEDSRIQNLYICPAVVSVVMWAFYWVVRPPGLLSSQRVRNVSHRSLNKFALM